MPASVDWQAGPRLVTNRRVVAAVDAALRHGGRAGLEVGVVLVDDETLAGMHAEWLDDPSPTDVISFDLGEESEGPAGEVYVSVDRARAVAGERGLDPAGELLLYVVHGVLHLCGFDDHTESDRRRMRAAEREVLDALGEHTPPGAAPDA